MLWRTGYLTGFVNRLIAGTGTAVVFFCFPGAEFSNFQFLSVLSISPALIALWWTAAPTPNLSLRQPVRLPPFDR
jgi:hypothetical protein